MVAECVVGDDSSSVQYRPHQDGVSEVVLKSVELNPQVHTVHRGHIAGEILKGLVFVVGKVTFIHLKGFGV